MRVCHRTVKLDLGQFGGSALTDTAIDIPEHETSGIPVTYVPARNTVMLATALAWAEVLGARAIFIGVNAVDYSGYPDCRPAFIEAFSALAAVATKAGVENEQIVVEAPLINMSKAEIIRTGIRLGVDLRANDFLLSARCCGAWVQTLRCLSSSATGICRTPGSMTRRFISSRGRARLNRAQEAVSAVQRPDRTYVDNRLTAAALTAFGRALGHFSHRDFDVVEPLVRVQAELAGKFARASYAVIADVIRRERKHTAGRSPEYWRQIGRATGAGI